MYLLLPCLPSSQVLAYTSAGDGIFSPSVSCATNPDGEWNGVRVNDGVGVRVAVDVGVEIGWIGSGVEWRSSCIGPEGSGQWSWIDGLVEWRPVGWRDGGVKGWRDGSRWDVGMEGGWKEVWTYGGDGGMEGRSCRSVEGWRLGGLVG